MQTIFKMCAVLVCLMVLSGCGQQEDTPITAVTNYVNARVAADESKLKSFTCKDK